MGTVQTNDMKCVASEVYGLIGDRNGFKFPDGSSYDHNTKTTTIVSEISFKIYVLEKTF